ncbi:oxidoreductase [Streptomyces sp. WAC 05379]|uniref:FAD-dependent monooxygenase n=1 Tax=Streptomyces sp. WAC 05379 TaxID=2203207 RepID=UPI000F74753F|nr:FAD-dependent monooxygenase [Streptomyces sp. WAC 05379]RSN92190.1 oxidoreductase [Streptomyces sp. WAC 05379]
MATRTVETDVLVVGAGPVGLMLAGELRLGGAATVVLERRDAPTTESRASTLHARTMELLDSRGLLDALGTPPHEPRGHFGGVPLDLTLPSPWPGQWKVPQTRTEELLQDWALGLGADLRRGHELRAVRVGEDGVEAVAAGPGGRALRVRARFVVGCDGEDSTLRRLTGAEFPGRDAGRELLRADVAGIDVPDRRFQRLEKGLAIAARRGDGVTRVMVHEFGAGPRRGEPEFGEVAQVWKRVTGEDIGSGDPLWVNSFGDADRQLTDYRRGPVLFAGDAAHQQMPIGGQALNLGLQDAVNLGWKLAAEVRGRAPAGLLDTYHAERHAVGRRVLANIRAQALLLLGGPEVEPVRALLGELIAERPQVRAHLAGMISGLDIRYDADVEDPLLGARLPYVQLRWPEGTLDTADLLRTGGRGLLLDLAGDARLRTAVRPWADRIVTVTARPAADSALGAARAVLVRPDGYVAWTGTEGMSDGPEIALKNWFGVSDRN